MKKYLAILSSILIITSCDVEDGPFITDYDSYVNPEKKVLIEDFTGIYVLTAQMPQEN